MRKHRIVTHAPRTKANSPITIYPNAVLPPKIVAAVSKPEEVPGSICPTIPGMANETPTITAKAWREINPELAGNSNVRDYATINELTVLSNLETHNAQMIREGRDKKERFLILKEIADYQLKILNEAQSINNQIEEKQ